jgi:hypothetical protein
MIRLEIVEKNKSNYIEVEGISTYRHALSENMLADMVLKNFNGPR